MKLSGARRTALVVAITALGLLGVVLGRVVVSSRAAFLEGRATERTALSQVDPDSRAQGLGEAIVHYRRAARWYAPGNSYATSALGRLEAIGRLAEQAGDATTALEAYRAMRRAILGARSVYTPHKDRLDRANGRIAILSARQAETTEGKILDAETIARMEAWHRKKLGQDTAPAVGWVLLALAGFLGWVGACVGFILGAVTRDDRLLGRRAILWGAGILAGLVAWLLGLTMA